MHTTVPLISCYDKKPSHMKCAPLHHQQFHVWRKGCLCVVRYVHFSFYIEGVGCRGVSIFRVSTPGPV